MSDPIRVLWLLKEFGAGGAERLLLDLAPALEGRVSFTPVAVEDEPRELEPAFREIGLEPRFLHAAHEADPRWMTRLRGLVRETRPDVVHTHGPVPGAGARIVLAGVPVPLVVTEHSRWSAAHLASRTANGITYARNDAAIAVSEPIARELRASVLARRGPVPVVVANGIDVARVETDAEKQRTSWSSPPIESPSYGVVGHLRRRKGIDVFLRAAALVEARVPDARGYVIGSGEDERELRALHRDLGLRRVELLGFRADARAITSALDVFVVPSRVEGLPIALLEAMALARPVVATRVGGVPDVITDGENGVLVPSEDPEALANAIVAMLGEPERAARLARWARRTVESGFDAARMAEGYRSVYERVLHRDRGTPGRSGRPHGRARSGSPAGTRAARGERPRVLRIATRLNVGGPARQIAYLHRAMPASFDHHLIAGSETAGEGRIDPGTEGVTVVPELARAMNPASDAAAYRSIARFVSAWRPDVVHTHMAKAGALGRLAFLRTRRRDRPVLVHTFHGHVLEGYFTEPVARAFVQAERRLARLTDALLAVSPQTRDELLLLGIGEPEQWRVVPVGVELGELLGPQPGAGPSRAALALPADGPVVGIVGRLVPIKDHDTFFDAAARLAHERPDVTFVVAGDGERRAELEARAGRLLRDRVRFLGWVEDLPTLYSALDVVVLTSRNEGTPVSLIEAGAAMKPSIATDVGGVREVVKEGRTGVLVPPGDSPALAEEMGLLLDDPGRAAEFGSAARQHVRARFSAERLLGDLSSLYDELLRAKGRSR